MERIRSNWHITLIYLAVGATWILTSDWLVRRLFGDAAASFPQTIKGLLYVLATAALIHWLVRRSTLGLARSEIRHREIFQYSPDAMLLLDEQLRVVDANRPALDLYGYPGAVMRQLRAEALIAGAFRDETADRIRRALDSGERIESRHRRADGTEFAVEVSVRAFQVDRAPGMLACIRDVTAQKRAEESLRASEARFRALFEHAPIGAAILDREGRLLAANVRLQGMLGRAPGELAGLRIADLTHPEDRDRGRGLFQELAEGGRDSYSVENRFVRPDGGTVWGSLAVAAVRDGQGAPETIIGMVEDITERRAAVSALRAAEARLSVLLSNLPGMAYRCLNEAAWPMEFVSEGCKALTGYEPSELMRGEVQYGEVIHPEDRRMVFDTVQRDTAHRRTFRLEYRIVARDGTVKWVWESGRIVSEPGAEPQWLEGFIADITERKRLEDQLNQSRKMEAIGQLAGGVAHDFNNLLQVINGQTEIALEELPGDHPSRESLRDIAGAGERAARLVGQLLAFSRRQILRPCVLDLNAVIEEFLKMLRRVIGEHIRLEFLPGSRLGSVNADRGMMEQVIMNLCINARDAMPQGGTLTIETENVRFGSSCRESHPWARPGRFVLLSVTDTGTGMDAQTIEHVFEPFFTTKEVGRGTGLGLATVYGIVRQHDGMTSVYSEPGKGTTFKIYLPMCEREAESVGTKIQGAAPEGSETVLLAEDDDSVRRLATNILERAGYTVVGAANGEEAVRLFESRPGEFDLLLLDVVMPGIGGRETYDILSRQRPDIPVLFSSGYSENAVHTNFILDRDLALLQKPYSREDLLRAVRAVLDGDRG